MKVKVLDTTGKETGKEVSLSKEVFGIEANDHAIYLAVKQYMANRRQGTHKSKERSEITGSRRKLKRQKGTGTARIGDVKSPLLRGGGRAFGPRPKDYSFKLNKKVKTLARKSALSHKAKDENIIVLEDFMMDGPKTKLFIQILENLGLTESKALLVLEEKDDNAYLASRNIPSTAIVKPENLNVYDILNCDKLVFSESAIKSIEKSLAE